MQVESRNFTVHKNILFSVMQSQAGTLGKALLEGVMNSIDAGATSCSVVLEPTRFSVQDNGRGIQTKDEIINWFEQFGTPHEQGDAVYGRFRMGRGQLMAFGVNKWRTSTFEMKVDIRNQGLDYLLGEKLKPVKGCRIDVELYEPLTHSGLDEVQREFADLVRFAQIPVRLNGKVVSKPPALASWDMETDDAYVKTSRHGDMLVYNLGVLVRAYPQYVFGCGGFIVSKLPLEVNFARNDVITHRCQVWQRIHKTLRAVNMAKVAAKSTLTADEREFLARQWAFEELPYELRSRMHHVKLFTDVLGRHHSLADIMQGPPVTVANEQQARVGGRLHREQAYFVLSKATLARFRVYDLDTLADKLEDVSGIRLTLAADEFATLAQGYGETYKALGDENLAPVELAVLQALRATHDKFFMWASGALKCTQQRELLAGESDVAEAWTDGQKRITLERRQLERAARRGVAGFFELMLTLVHEYCHDDADLESHEHDLVFYNKHHDALQYRSGKLHALTTEAHAKFMRLAKKSGLAVMQDAGRAKPCLSAASAAGAARRLVAHENQLGLFTV